MISEGGHVPQDHGVHSNWVFGCNTGCDWERPMEHGWVLLGPISIGVLGGHDEVWLSCEGHVILEGIHIPKAVGCILTRVPAVTSDATGRGPWGPGWV